MYQRVRDPLGPTVLLAVLEPHFHVLPREHAHAVVNVLAEPFLGPLRDLWFALEFAAIIPIPLPLQPLISCRSSSTLPPSAPSSLTRAWRIVIIMIESQSSINRHCLIILQHA